MKVEEIFKETIKPASPTPSHLQSFRLSILDQFAITDHSLFVLFYSNTNTLSSAEASQYLKKSLSETLTRFYPLAGRIRDHLKVDCNDDGADYIEARADCSIVDVLEQPKAETLEQFVRPSSGPPNTPLLIIQATFFECGGMALGVSVSHKIADADTFVAFIKDWAATALGSPGTMEPDLTTAISLFPPNANHVPNEVPIKLGNVRRNVIRRRYLFRSSCLEELRAKAASSSVPRPTRVEAISALIWKCAMNASRSSRGYSRRSVLHWLANIRPIGSNLDPPLLKNSFGNLVLPMLVDHQGNETDSPGLVHKLRRGMTEFRDFWGKKLSGESNSCEYYSKCQKMEKLVSSGDVDMHTHTSWCRFPFYEIDFGWGKPTWATCVPWASIPDVAYLMDARDADGIEAWVTVAEEDLASFESDQELLAYASLNPSALN